MIMQSEDERRVADQYKEQVCAFNLRLLLLILSELFSFLCPSFSSSLSS